MSDTDTVDTETTGHNEPVAVEVAWLELSAPHHPLAVRCFEKRYNPGKPIELGAMATHHILDEEVADCPPASDFKLPEDAKYIVGHNVDYDWQVLGQPAVKRICTLALSRWMYPDIDSHSQSAMVYFYFGAQAKAMLRNAHSAMADVRNCIEIMLHLVEDLQSAGNLGPEPTWEDVWTISERARIPTKMTFGKHKGELISDIPRDYKQWLLRQPDVDPYLEKALRGFA